MLVIAIFCWALPVSAMAQTDDSDYYEENYDSSSSDEYSSDEEYYYDDYDDYSEEYHYEMPCEHRGNSTYWQTLVYKSSLENYNKPLGSEGWVRFSDSCIEIDCTAMKMYFGLSTHQRVTPEYYRAFRDRADEIFDVMEIRKGFGPNKGKFVIFIGQATPDGHLKNTVQLICLPLRVDGKRQLELPPEMRAWISDIEKKNR